MDEDPDEQLGKLINSGFFFEEEKPLCPKCIVRLKWIKEHNHYKCVACQSIISFQSKDPPPAKKYSWWTK